LRTRKCVGINQFTFSDRNSSVTRAYPRYILQSSEDGLRKDNAHSPSRTGVQFRPHKLDVTVLIDCIGRETIMIIQLTLVIIQQSDDDVCFVPVLNDAAIHN
jgi:hypothetical protein